MDAETKILAEEVKELVFESLEKRSGLFSPSTLRRSFVVYGHAVLAGFILNIGFLILALVLSALFS